MVTLYKNPTLTNISGAPEDPNGGYQGYVEPDTRIPPKAKPVLDAISVNGVTIPEADILAEAQNHPAEVPGEALVAAAQALVVRELCLQEARRCKIEAIAETDAGGRSETPDEAAIRMLIEREVTVPLASEQECLRFYTLNRSRFCSEPVFMARHILLAASAGDNAARQRARTEAERLIAHLQDNPEDFAHMAQQYSACPSKDQQGNLGQLTTGSTVAEFEAALREMAPGKLHPQPVATPFGFHVVFLDRREPGRQLPFEAVEKRIAGWLEAASWSRAVSQYVSILAAQADIRGIELKTANGPLVQ